MRCSGLGGLLANRVSNFPVVRRTDVPSGVLCAGSFPTVQRVCRCDAPNKQQTFGTGLSNGMITTNETFLFSWVLAPGDVGYMTHFWNTYGSSVRMAGGVCGRWEFLMLFAVSQVDDGVIIRYYIDGETTASIEFTPSMACGVGFYDPQAPWGTKWFGKGAADGGWFLNFKIPFQKSVLVTFQHLTLNSGGFYIIVRGATNLPFSIGGVSVPTNARLQLFKTQGTFQPLEWLTLANVSAGVAGMVWQPRACFLGSDWQAGCPRAVLMVRVVSLWFCSTSCTPWPSNR